MAIGTVKAPSALSTEQQDNNTNAINEGAIRNASESAFSISVSPNGVKTGNYTPAAANLDDRGCIVPFNAASAANFTIPPNSSNAYAVGNVLGLVWLSGAAGRPGFVAGSGVTLVSGTGTTTARAAGSIIWAWQYSTNTWYVFGDLA
mgnify:CR=1 FL=1|jgi:hypothetical protein